MDWPGFKRAITYWRQQPLVDNPAFIDIHASGCDQVWIRTVDGETLRGPPVAASHGELMRQIANSGAW